MTCLQCLFYLCRMTAVVSMNFCSMDDHFCVSQEKNNSVGEELEIHFNSS